MIFFVTFNNQLPQEAPAVIPDRRPPSNWPSAGEMDIKNLTLKVRLSFAQSLCPQEKTTGVARGKACARRATTPPRISSESSVCCLVAHTFIP